MAERADLIETLKEFKNRRDDALYEDDSSFEHHLSRLIEFLDQDSIVSDIVAEHFAPPAKESDDWWQAAQSGEVAFPSDRSEELGFRLQLAREGAADPRKIRYLLIRGSKTDPSDRVNFFRSVVLGPLFRALTDHLSEVAGIPGPEARALQAVPLHRIPKDTEVRIFLSHKSVDKPLVYRFYQALKELGYAPWLDEPDMPVGTNLERGVLRGFQESCAAVFFITDNFKDEKYLAAEVDYAVQQKREKGNRFAIITLRFEGSAPVPGLLTPYVYKDVSDDLDAFREITRALPIELGPIRWREHVTAS